MKENKYKYLLKNIGLLTISNFGTKILSIILIPLYTSILSTAEYGIYDIYFTTISLLIPILTLNIIESVMRFSLEKEKDKTEIFSIGLKYIIKSSIVFGLLILINNYFHILVIFEEFSLYMMLIFVFELLYELLVQFSRGIERVFDIAVAGFINSLAIISTNIIMLVVLKQGLNGYFIANIIGYVIPTIYLIFRIKVWKYIDFSKKNLILKKEMFAYSKPLVFNTIAWWINNVSDRYIVTWICGVAENGIYSIAYKIPSILNIFQAIFGQAWTVSAVKEYKDDNKGFYTMIYKIYNLGMVVVCSLLILGDKLIAKILFANDFYIAWKYAPFLMISVVFGALSGMLGGIFSANKDSKIFAKTTIIGASVNTLLNIVLVYSVGPLGAAISTLVSYILVWFFRLKEANKLVKLNINLKRDIFSYIILIIQSLVLLLQLYIIIEIILEIMLICVVFIMYNKEIKEYSCLIMNKIKTKFRRIENDRIKK